MEVELMPEVKQGESEQEWLGRCIPYQLNENPDMEKDQAAAICYSMYEKSKKNEEVTMSIIDKIDRILTEDVDIENFIRRSLNTPKSQDAVWKMVKTKFKDDADRDEFDEIWDSFVDDDYLESAGGDKYKWSE